MVCVCVCGWGGGGGWGAIIRDSRVIALSCWFYTIFYYISFSQKSSKFELELGITLVLQVNRLTKGASNPLPQHQI